LKERKEERNRKLVARKKNEKKVESKKGKVKRNK
jgi:hypothetical protein